MIPFDEMVGDNDHAASHDMAGEDSALPGAPAGGSARFAEVVVAVPLRRQEPGPAHGVPPRRATYHYFVSEELVEHVVPGCLVWVPFGRQRVMGCVLALDETPPVENVRPIESIVGPGPTLSGDLVTLARWMSEAYLAPLWECVNAMLPPGAVSHELVVWSRTDQRFRADKLDADQLKVLGLFTGGVELTEQEVRTKSRLKGHGRILADLAKAGLLTESTQRVGRRVTRARETYIWLAEAVSAQTSVDQAAVDRAAVHPIAEAESSGALAGTVQAAGNQSAGVQTAETQTGAVDSLKSLRSVCRSASADVVGFLGDRADREGGAPVEAVLEAVRCPAGVVTRLVNRRLLTHSPGSRRVRPVVSPGSADWTVGRGNAAGPAGDGNDPAGPAGDGSAEGTAGGGDADGTAGGGDADGTAGGGDADGTAGGGDADGTAGGGDADGTAGGGDADGTAGGGDASSAGPPDLSRTPAQRELYEALVAAGDWMDARELLAATGRSEGPLDSLIKSGHVELDQSPDLVALAAPETSRELEIELRGVGAHLAVVDYLREHPGQHAVSDLKQRMDCPPRVVKELERSGLIGSTTKAVWRDPVAGRTLDVRPPPHLTPDQLKAWVRLEEVLSAAPSGPSPAGASPTGPSPAGASPTGASPAGASPTGATEDRAAPTSVTPTAKPAVVLLHGVTGSGKTELYLRSIRHVVDRGGTAIVLVPEIALAPQTVQRVAGRFDDIVGIWHSQLSEGERRDTWERARRGELKVIVGSRSALFAPLPNLRLIIVDEEHADAYKQAQNPRYHARETAIARAGATGAAVLLGSATPSVEAYWESERGAFERLELPRRVAAVWQTDGATGSYGSLPEVEIVDMRAELQAGHLSIFSRRLIAELDRCLADNSQAILFLNRRGSATFILCRDCGHVESCPRCDGPLTYHRPKDDLTCHRCGHRQPAPMMCRNCGSRRIRYFGLGTQRVEEEVRARYPEARMLRWDADTTGRKGSHEAILARFADRKADILVGTQMIAKGLDLPAVTLVGVISADTSLQLPDFRSSERTFQLLAQVAGRAGRAEQGGQVIVQTYRPEEPAIQAAARHDYEGFFKREVAFRGEHLYPPYSHFVSLVTATKSNRGSEKSASELAASLKARILELGLPDTEVIGPAPCFFHRVRGKYRWQVLIRTPDPHALLEDWVFPPGWRVDVDPVSTL